MDEIEFHVTDRLQSLAESTCSYDRLNDVKQYAGQGQKSVGGSQYKNV